jgi:sarcosine oxidase delta subunit
MRELVECPHCGYKFRTDVKARAEDGETIAVRSILHWKPKSRRVKSIDLECPNCGRRFEYEVEL